MQEAFVNLHRRWSHLRDQGSAVAYLNQAVVNGGRDRLRHGRRGVVLLPRMVPVPEERPSAEQDAVRHDEAERLWQAITALAVPAATGARPALLPRPERGRDRRHPRGVAGFGEDACEPRPGRTLSDLGGRLMSASELERRLGEVLRQHAEDAMNSTDTQTQLETLERGLERNRPRTRTRWVAAAAAAAAVIAALVVVDAPRRRPDRTLLRARWTREPRRSSRRTSWPPSRRTTRSAQRRTSPTTQASSCGPPPWTPRRRARHAALDPGGRVPPAPRAM